jgi:lysophospholipase L1-like esterase
VKNATIKLITLFISFTLLSGQLFSQTNPQIKVTIIGDSNTQAYGIPGKTQAALGDAFLVVNRGLGGRCLRFGCNAPYTSSTVYQQALRDLSDYYVIILGTNDSRSMNWKPTSDPGYPLLEADFINSYLSLISTLRALPSNPIVLVVTPSKMASSATVLSFNDPAIVSNVLRPLIKNIAIVANAPVADVNGQIDITPDSAGSFTDILSDGVHLKPSAASKFGYEIKKAICNNPRKSATCTSSNIAYLGTTTQSNIYTNSFAHLAIDGGTSGLWSSGTISSTNYAFQPWWELDLGKITNVSRLKFWPRNDVPLAVKRNANMFILTSVTPFTSNDLQTEKSRPGVNVYSYPVPSADPTEIVVSAGSKNMQYIRVWLGGTGSSSVLSIAEFQAFD